MLRFPDQFLWGAATSHFQIEGNPLEIASRSSDWSNWTFDNGHIADRTTADQACEFYKRYAADLDLLSKLNLNAFRFSINWAAICPETSSHTTPLTLNRQEVERYRELLTTLKAKGITTFATLFHFCLPKRLAQIGGWQSQTTVQEFVRLAELLAHEYKGLVDYWLTINEPLVYAYQGYVAGRWPPGLERAYEQAFLCVRHMLEAHALAYQAIHSQDSRAKVSYTMHWRPFHALNPWNPSDQAARHLRNRIFNHLFPTAVQTGTLTFPLPFKLQKFVQRISGPIVHLKDSIDYLAINYYTRDICQFRFKRPFDMFGVKALPKEQELDGMGWENYPHGLYELLTDGIKPYRLDSKLHQRPIIITENGWAGAFPADMQEGDWSLDDQPRIAYLLSHLMAIHKAISQGINVKGYLHWSLLDNFEWAEGLRTRFGLVRVAFPTQERRFRKSAEVYADIARLNAIDTNSRHLQI